MQFTDRTHAGQRLGDELKSQGFASDHLVVALPRGGIPVAYGVAQQLDAALDLLVIRKYGVPGYEELTMGAMGPGHTLVLNDQLLNSLGISRDEIEAVMQLEERELQKRLASYEMTTKPRSLAGRQIILVDDGTTSSASMRVACQALRQFAVRSLHVAMPVVAPTTLENLKTVADDVIYLEMAKAMVRADQCYDDPNLITDDEAVALLQQSWPVSHLHPAS